VSVVGAGEVEAAATAGVLTLGPRDIVTPLARERARDLGVQLVVGTPGTAAAVAGDRLAPPAAAQTAPSTPAVRGTGGTRPESASSDPSARTTGVGAPLFGAAPPLPMPPVGALFRRGAPLPAAVRGAGGVTGRVVVVGAGNVGTITAMRLAEADVFTEIVLVDVDEGRAQGVALDLTHAAALAGFATRVRGTGVIEDAGPADYVVITAGRARQPGMSRSDLVSTNAAVVGDVATRVASTCPDAVILVVTNPLDEMTQHAWRASGFPSHRVLGMAGVDSGAEVGGLLRSGSAFVAPGAAAARMVLAMAADSDQVMTAAVLADGSYGIRDVYVGLPVRLGRHGLREIVHLDLRPDELAALRAAADRIRDRVGQLTP
jgi:malate dehydrogenase